MTSLTRRFGLPFFVVFSLFIVALSGCGNKGGDRPSGLTEQQKGVLGGTPPPGEMAKIEAERAQQAQKQAEGQAKAQAEAAAKGGK